MKKIALWLLFAGTLTACSSTATRHYQLPDSAFTPPSGYAAQDLVSIKVVLAEPINSSSLLYQSDAHTVHLTQNNLWASPLSDSLANALANKLNRAGSLHYRPANALNSKNTLTIYIDRFQGNYQGYTEISGYAQWQNGNTRPFHVQTPQYGDGYAAMLESLNTGLDKIAQQLTQ